MKSTFKCISKSYTAIGQRVGAAFAAPTKAQAQVMLMLVGATILSLGFLSNAEAGGGFVGGGGGGGGGLRTRYNDDRLADAINAILLYVEGTFGAMVMVAAGIGAILSSAFGQYRAALGLLVVAVGAFILRSLVGTFFNDANVMP